MVEHLHFLGRRSEVRFLEWLFIFYWAGSLHQILVNQSCEVLILNHLDTCQTNSWPFGSVVEHLHFLGRRSKVRFLERPFIFVGLDHSMIQLVTIHQIHIVLSTKPRVILILNPLDVNPTKLLASWFSGRAPPFLGEEIRGSIPREAFHFCLSGSFCD